MKQKSTLRTAASAAYIIVVLLFFLFFIYIGLFENTSVYKARDTRSYATVKHYTMEQVADSTAPVGVRTVYNWTLPATGTNENCLCFYIVHHYAEVYFDDELMYSLMPSEDNQLGDSISSNWVTVPIYPEDSGKEITVILTPLFESVISNEVEFLVGSHFTIIFDQLKNDLPQLFMSLLCIVLGIFIITVQVYFTIRTKDNTWDLFFLGLFSIMLGLWRITDTKFSPFLFSGNTMVLGYITIGALFLCSIPLLLFVSTHFPGKQSTPLLIISLIGTLIAFLALLLQVLGIADFKESLVFSHVVLIVTIIAVLLASLLHSRTNVSSRINTSWKYFLLLAAGILLDMVSFYITVSSSSIIFSVAALILYISTMFTTSIFDATKQVYTDSPTGLSNKARWDELMNDNTPIADSIGIIMMDLNQLKHTNDTMGHEAGDRMIFNFCNILRNTLPPNSVICRWGGDEFAAFIIHVSNEKMTRYTAAIHEAVDSYNRSGALPTISFAIGHALSSELPGLTRMELFEEADRRMYEDKQKWYSENSAGFTDKK